MKSFDNRRQVDKQELFNSIKEADSFKVEKYLKENITLLSSTQNNQNPEEYISYLIAEEKDEEKKNKYKKIQTLIKDKTNIRDMAIGLTLTSGAIAGTLAAVELLFSSMLPRL